MATKEIEYISYSDAVLLHIELMRLWGETRFGVCDRTLVESALARPRQAAAYERADLIRQASTLYFGLVKNHPWVGGNKRTATALVDEFLFRNGIEVVASTRDNIETSLAIDADRWGVDEIEDWLRQHTAQKI